MGRKPKGKRREGTYIPRRMADARVRGNKYLTVDDVGTKMGAIPMSKEPVGGPGERSLEGMEGPERPVPPYGDDQSGVRQGLLPKDEVPAPPP